MSVIAEIQDNRIFITSELRDTELCKLVPGRRYDRDSRRWHVPLSWAACKQLRAVFGYRLEIGPELLKWAQNELENRIKPSVLLRDTMGLEEGHPVLLQLQEFGYA